jgi:hypothetical protein
MSVTLRAWLYGRGIVHPHAVLSAGNTTFPEGGGSKRGIAAHSRACLA